MTDIDLDQLAVVRFGNKSFVTQESIERLVGKIKNTPSAAKDRQ